MEKKCHQFYHIVLCVRMCLCSCVCSWFVIFVYHSTLFTCSSRHVTEFIVGTFIYWSILPVQLEALLASAPSNNAIQSVWWMKIDYYYLNAHRCKYSRMSKSSFRETNGNWHVHYRECFSLSFSFSVCMYECMQYSSQKI